ncbi:MAG TPA: ATP-binding protein [Solirubrobacterales bacterium]
MTELAGALVGWQLGASAAAAVLLIRSWRRRAALNEALHELRRPLQALALAAPGQQETAVVDSSLRLATAALDRLDREINGGRAVGDGREMVAVWPLLESAVERWRVRASLAGASLTLRRGAVGATVEAERLLFSQAIDNLIVNAIEHGGPSIVVEAAIRGERLRISVADEGGARRPAARSGSAAGVLARLTGRRRRGNGLSVVRRIAATHAGRFALQRSTRGSRAVLELPLTAAVHR